MNRSEEKPRTDVDAAVRTQWEPMRLNYLGDVAKLVLDGDNPAGKGSLGVSPDSPKFKSPGL